MTYETLHPLNDREIVKIEGKRYVPAARLDAVVDRAATFVPVWFVRTADYHWFPDDPAIGLERWAFRESRLDGPFYTREDLKRVKGEQEKVAKGFERETGLALRMRVNVFGRVVPEEDIASLRVERMWRSSLIIGIDELEWTYHKERLADKERELRGVYDTVLRALEEQKRGPLRKKGNQTRGLMGDPPHFVIVNPRKREQGGGMGIELFTIRERIAVADLFNIPLAYFLGKAENHEYDVHASSEEFASVALPVVVSVDDQSIEETVEKNHLIPGKVEVLGKQPNTSTLSE